MIEDITPIFEWDEQKNLVNYLKHGLAFEEAQLAFADPLRVIARDAAHSTYEDRFYCIGRIEQGIATVRFTYRSGKTRILGAGFWRKGRKFYEQKNSKIH